MEYRKVKLDTSKEDFSSVLSEILDQGQDVTITITGDSMLPLWKHNRDTVVLAKCDKAGLKKGDIPLYRRNNCQLVMHRIIKVNKDTYNLCGDAQTHIEYNVNTKNIIAVVKTFTRKGKEYSCSNLWYRLYTVLWVSARPFRHIILRGYRLFNRLVPHTVQQQNPKNNGWR